MVVGNRSDLVRSGFLFFAVRYPQKSRDAARRVSANEKQNQSLRS
jgi:hypothetical protein